MAGVPHRELGYGGCVLPPSCPCHPTFTAAAYARQQAICSLDVPFLSILSQPLGNTASLDEMKPEAARQPEDSPVAPWETVRVAWDVWSRCCLLLTQAGCWAIVGLLGLSLFRPCLLFCPLQPTVLHMGPLAIEYSPHRSRTEPARQVPS